MRHPGILWKCFGHGPKSQSFLLSPPTSQGDFRDIEANLSASLELEKHTPSRQRFESAAAEPWPADGELLQPLSGVRTRYSLMSYASSESLFLWSSPPLASYDRSGSENTVV